MPFIKDLLKKFKPNDAKTKKVFSYLKQTDPMNEWDNIGEIGVGAFGKVLEGKNKTDGKLAALKQVELEEEGDLEEYIIEIEILTECKHANIINLYSAYHFDKKLWMALEYCNGGALDSVMLALDHGLDEPAIKYVSREVLNGLIFLHEHSIIHRDMKAGNVLVTKESEVKLADFGVSARVTAEKNKRNTVQGTPYWMAPEVINCQHLQDSSYDARADVWSYGITLIELAEMSPPFHNLQPNRVLLRIPKSDPPTLKNPKKFSDDFSQFLKRCLTKDSSQRPFSADLKNDKFISNITVEDKKSLRMLIYKSKPDAQQDVVVDIDEEKLVDMKIKNNDSTNNEDDRSSIASSLHQQNVTTDKLSDSPKKTSPVKSTPKLKDQIVSEIVESIISSQITSVDDNMSVCGAVCEVMQEYNPKTDIDETVKTIEQKQKDKAKTPFVRQDSMKIGMEESTLEVVEINTDKDSSSNKHEDTTSNSTTDNDENNPDPKKFARTKSHYRTMTRTKKFMMDGVEVTTVDTKVVREGQENKRVDDINERRDVLRAMKVLGKIETRQKRQKAFRIETERNELMNKLKAEEVAQDRNYENDIEKLSKEHKNKLDKLETEKQNEIKNLEKKLSVEKLKKEEEFKKEDRNEFMKMSSSNASNAGMKFKRKDNLKRNKENYNTLIQEKLRKYSDDLTQQMNDKLTAESKRNRQDLFKLEKSLLQERMDRRKKYDDAVTKRELSDANAINQQKINHNKEYFAMRRQQIKTRQDKELELLDGENKKELEELESIQANERKSIPRHIKITTKVRLEQKRQELVILNEKGIITSQELKSRLKNFSDAEKEREKQDSERALKKLDRSRKDLITEHQQRRKENDQIHAEQKKDLTVKENEEEKDLKKKFDEKKKELEKKANERRESTDKCLKDEMNRLQQFYCSYETPNGSVTEYSDSAITQNNSLGYSTYAIENRF